MYSCVEDRVELLRGLVDTDGYVYNSHIIEYCTTSEILAYQVQELVRSLGGRSTINTKEEPTYVHNGNKMIGRVAFRVYIRFGSEVDFIPVKSKKNLSKYGTRKNSRISKTIENIEYAGEEECVCISVDSEDSLYVTDDYILTHNTAIQTSLVVLLDPYIRTITMVPSANLAEQTYKDYIKCDDIADNVLLLSSKIPPKRREEEIKTHRHIVVTTKLFQNLSELFEEDYALLYDEAHVLGDITAEKLRFDLGHCPIRIGLTGTLPTDKLKKMKLLCHIGGDVIKRVTSHHLLENNYASKFHIEMIATLDKEIQGEIDELSSMDGIEGKDVYDFETKYMNTNEHRINAIAEYVQEFDLSKNTLILCHPQLGSKLSKTLGTVMIDGEVTDSTERHDHFSRFDKEDNVLICASYGTSSTGLSYNRIKRLILIDAGKNINAIIQSIGRGMRLDGEDNWFDVIDIDSDTKYAKRHRKERIKAYKQEKYDFTELKNYIAVYKGE
jgi:hypothetical protein